MMQLLSLITVLGAQYMAFQFLKGFMPAAAQDQWVSLLFILDSWINKQFMHRNVLSEMHSSTKWAAQSSHVLGHGPITLRGIWIWTTEYRWA